MKRHGKVMDATLGVSAQHSNDCIVVEVRLPLTRPGQRAEELRRWQAAAAQHAPIAVECDEAPEAVDASLCFATGLRGDIYHIVSVRTEDGLHSRCGLPIITGWQENRPYHYLHTIHETRPARARLCKKCSVR